ncbi:unnamed protein product [Larinioides sclopetarius]|uniref:MYB transcription factor n=1 Tax=Larinioides sclopetarius TaxID=280406 RepID=A0AAV2B9I9_9ARAC
MFIYFLILQIWEKSWLDGNRTGEECEMMWNNYLSIFIKKGPFTAAEDEKLKQLVEKYNGKNWDAIAEELQTGRSAIQCFERYQKCLNKALRKKYWTPQEDAKLLHLVESNRIGDFIPWNIVCSQMEGRERHQVINRYERTINNRNKRSPWSRQEDAMLLMCVKKFGAHWTRMKEYIPGRNPYNIRERYVNILDPYIKCGPWTKAEDLKLTELVQEYGYGKWSTIAKEVPGRTDNMCLIRANYLGLKRSGKPKMNGCLNGEFSDESNEEAQCRKRRAPRTAAKPSTRLRIQSEALETLKAALLKVAPSVVDESTETINVPSINAALLRNLHKELYKNENRDASAYWKPRYLSHDGVSRIDFKKQNRYKRKKKDHRIEDTESEEDENDEHFSDIEMEEEKELNNEEIMWLHNVLMSQFNEAEDLIKMPTYITKINLNSRHSAECIIYERYLQQKLMCTNIPEDEDDFIFSGNNYNLTLADVAHHFVQPPVSEDSTMVLSPNWATLNGMDIIQTSEKRLHRTGRFIHQSVPYIRYLTGRSSAYPKCIKCCMAKNSEVCAEKFNMNQMKANLIMPSEDMKIAAMVENGHPSVQEQNCCCEELAESKAAANLLAKRFMSLFLWPSLLSSVNLCTEQEELMVRKKQSRGPRKRPSLQSDTFLNNKKRRLNGSKNPSKMVFKNESGDSTTVSTKVRRKQQYGSNSRRSLRKIIVKQENGSENNSKRESAITSVQSLESPLRRSRRSAVLQRRSFAFVDKSDEECS